MFPLINRSTQCGAVTKDRTVSAESLPFPPTPSASTAGRTMQESVYKRRVEPRRLPEDAPNILIVLIDDAGPGLPTTFGGEVDTPTMDRIVREGIAYNRFHTTAMCSPTRASLLTGRNHHRVAQRTNRGTRQRLGRLRRDDPEEQCAGRRGPQGLRLQHLRVRQVAQHAGDGDHRGRAVRELADEHRLRIFLRVPRRRGLAVRTESRAQHHQRPAAAYARGGLSPQRGSGRRCHRLAAPAQGVSGRQAVLHVLGERRDPRSAPQS